MDKAAPNRRRWFQFGLRAMFVLLTLAAFSAAWIASERRIATARRRFLLGEDGRAQPAFVPAENDLSFWRRYFGDQSRKSISLPPSATAADIAEAHRLFPEAEIEVSPENIGLD
jgi:hypothetical protein